MNSERMQPVGHVGPARQIGGCHYLVSLTKYDGPRPRTPERKGRTMATHGDLLAAIRERNEGRVAEILKAEPNLASARPTDGPSAMLFATYMGVAPVIALVRARVEPDACEAAALGDMPALTALLKKKENANARSGDGWTALHLAGFFGKRDAVTLLLKHGASVSAVAGTPDRNQPLQASISGACDLVILTALIG